MAGKIINSKEREKLLISYLAIIEEATTRRALINVWRAGRLCFSADDRRLEILTTACTFQNDELNNKRPLRSVKGGKADA